MQETLTVQTNEKQAVNVVLVKKAEAPLSYNEMFEEFSKIYEQGISTTYNKGAGKVRHNKGDLVVRLAKKMLEYAAIKAGLDVTKLTLVEGYKIYIPFYNVDYLTTLKDDVADYILDHPEEFPTMVDTDLSVFYDGKIIAILEAKAYMDTTMFKRFAAESGLVKARAYPTTKFLVFQLENGIGGDYHEDKTDYFGSVAAHSWMGAENVAIDIRTILDGTRKSTQPLHKKEFHKSISKFKFFNVLTVYSEMLTKQVVKNQITLL